MLLAQTPIKGVGGEIVTKVFKQGDEEGEHRSGLQHGGQEAEELAGRRRGPRPDGERWSGAPQPHRNDSHTRLYRFLLSCFLQLLVASSRTAAKNWSRTSPSSAPLWRVCCTDMER